MKWITRKEVKQAAKKSRQTAIKMSIKHWQQLEGASFYELRNKQRSTPNILTENYCALCQRFKKNNRCGACPLYSFGYICCKEYDLAELVYHKKPYKHSLFQFAAGIMSEKLETLK